jgi:hypothetical protein
MVLMNILTRGADNDVRREALAYIDQVLKNLLAILGELPYG